MTDYSKITALYSRLSVGDEDRDGGESNSIQNQKIFLENYARGQHLTNIRHYIDDDESGRFFDRSAYSRMMDDVENGKIGVCIMKDLTRWGRDYEEFFITAFDGDVMGLYDYLTEYENLDELNHLAHLISELDSDEIERLEAALNKGDHTSSVADIINLVHNLECYDLHPGVTDDETLGRIYVEDMELLDVPDNVQPYFDFEAYGRDMRINEGGHFAPTGYLTRSGDFKEVYHGIEDIPAEHRIFAYPKLNIREQMAAYKEVIDRSSLEGEHLHPRKEHDDR